MTNTIGLIGMKKSILVKASHLVVFCLLSFAIITGFLILFDETKPFYYSLLPLLPFSFACILLLSLIINKNLLKRWFTLIPVILYYVKNVLTPFIMFLGSYYGSFQKLTIENVQNGIFLMVWECFCVLLFISFYCKKIRSVHNNNLRLERGQPVTKARNDFGILAFLVFFVLLLVFLFSGSIRSSYTSIFNQDGLRVELTTNSDFEAGSSTRTLLSLFQVVFPIFYMFGLTGIMVFVNNHSKIPNLIKIVITICLILFPAFFMDNGDGHTLISIASLFITALFINPKNRKFIVLAIITAIVIIAAYVFVQAMINTFVYKNLALFDSISNMMQAYFPGVCNTAGIFNIKEYDKFQELFFDVYSTIPFRNTLFGLSGYTNLPNLYTIDNNALSHIMPCIGHAFYYIGVFAPLIPCFLFYLAFKVYSKMMTTANPYKYVSYCILFVYLELTPIMYNLVIFGSHFFSQLLPMILLAFLSSNSYKTQYEK